MGKRESLSRRQLRLSSLQDLNLGSGRMSKRKQIIAMLLLHFFYSFEKQTLSEKEGLGNICGQLAVLSSHHHDKPIAMTCSLQSYKHSFIYVSYFDV